MEVRCRQNITSVPLGPDFCSSSYKLAFHSYFIHISINIKDFIFTFQVGDLASIQNIEKRRLKTLETVKEVQRRPHPLMIDNEFKINNPFTESKLRSLDNAPAVTRYPVENSRHPRQLPRSSTCYHLPSASMARSCRWTSSWSTLWIFRSPRIT